MKIHELRLKPGRGRRKGVKGSWGRGQVRGAGEEQRLGGREGIGPFSHYIHSWQVSNRRAR
ncbi:hypothetical protein E2C01_041331 [Portunus trituberculatus]|uniref:Uncharacterized protein n=1 Tax=Portunus trituberculatus TaxID=210409 RepID=A0A5B7FJS3_PORTR|nr:hypothetical protein [Portunus trituberculatus]